MREFARSIGNPKFNTTLSPGGLGRQSKTLFEGTTVRVFPLKANMYLLRTFCDAYLNVAPEIATFTPTLPFVLLMVIDYGRMAAETANAGWVSQREVAFAVPLEWYDTREDPENPRFVDYAAVCPFIYVDDELSLAMGRRVYGWPKVKVWAGEEVNPWIDDPNSDLNLLSLSTMVFPELYAGKRQKPEVFLDIRRSVLPTLTTFPADPSHSSNPFSVVPEALKGYLSMWTGAFEMFTRSLSRGYAPGSPMEPLLSLQRMGSWGLSALTRNAVLNNVTLKQFRDAHEPHRACYQALINSAIHLKRFNTSGILGESNQLMGDPTGGFSIGVRRYAAQPIIESLGLEVSQEIRVNGVSEAILRPVFPFWMGVDLEYGTGDHIAWRTKQSRWSAGEPGDTPPPPPLRPGSHGAHFNTARGAALQGVTGPFEFPNTTVRVLPLLADPDRLQKICTEYLSNDFVEFEAWGSYVYLIATNYDEMSSATNNIGWWADRELNFYIPVKVRNKAGAGELVSVGIVPMFSFTNTSTAAITGAEVLGLPSVRASLDSPADTWMGESGPSDSKDQPLLTCRTQVLPALHMGQKAEMGELLAIDQADVLPAGDERWTHLAANWGHDFLQEHRRKVKKKRKMSVAFDDARALALEILAQRQPVNIFSLKQFGDAHDPSLACYQSIVRLRRVVEHVYDLEEIEDQIHVRIHRQPTQPIVRKLGLAIKWTDTAGGNPVDVLQPVRPFWMKVALRGELGQTVCWRSGSLLWQPGEEMDLLDPEDRTPAHRGYFERVDGWSAGVGRALASWPDERAGPLSDLAHHWLHDEDTVEQVRLSHAEAVEAVEAMEPQMVLEPILSRRWGRKPDPSDSLHLGYMQKPKKPDFCVRVDSLGPLDDGRYLNGPGQLTEDHCWYSEDVNLPKKKKKKA